MLDFKETRGTLGSAIAASLNRETKKYGRETRKHLYDLANNLRESFARKHSLARKVSASRAFCAQIEDVSAQLGSQPAESPPVAVTCAYL